MEKDTITIEIKQEVSVTLLWIVGGVILVSLAFFLTPSAMDLWPSLNAAGIAGAVYLLAMTTYALRKPMKTSLRIRAWVAVVVILALGAFTWMRMQQQTEWQAATLIKIRGVVSRGEMRNEMMSSLAIRTLNEFYRQYGVTKQTLADVFRRQNEGAAPGLNIHTPQWPRDYRQVIVAKLEPALIELVSQETYVKGRDPLFKNYNGQVGMIQEKLTLTEKGIVHVSEN